MKIKLYRHTIEPTEWLSDDDKIVTYKQTEWQSVYNYIPRFNGDIVLIEEKYIEIDDSSRRKKNVKNN